MRYYVTLDPDPDAAAVVVDVKELPSGALDVRLDGRKVDVDVVALGAGTLSARVDGAVVDLTVEGAPPEIGAVASGHRSYVRVSSERMRAAEAARKATAGASDKVVRSPMPGRIVKVLVAKGDSVVAGQSLLVIEAMKMENELKAKSDATVADVLVEAGMAVEGNAKLVTFV
jgi:biotin carboxyl carrier protein